MNHFEKILAIAIAQLKKEGWTHDEDTETVEDPDGLEIAGQAVADGAKFTRHTLSLRDNNTKQLFGPDVEVYHDAGAFLVKTDWDGSYDTLIDGTLDDESLTYEALLHQLREGERISRESRRD